MPFTLETWSVFSTQKQVWMCALHPKNICLHFFFSLWGQGVGYSLFTFSFSISKYLLFIFFINPTDIYYNEPNTRLLSLWPTLKPKRWRKKRENLRKSPPFIQVNQASGLCKQQDRAWRFILFWCWNQHEFSRSSLSVTGCNVLRWDLEGCTKAKALP